MLIARLGSDKYNFISHCIHSVWVCNQRPPTWKTSQHSYKISLQALSGYSGIQLYLFMHSHSINPTTFMINSGCIVNQAKYQIHSQIKEPLLCRYSKVGIKNRSSFTDYEDVNSYINKGVITLSITQS